MNPSDPSLRVVGRTCPLCEATCGLRLTLRGDRVERVTGDPDDPFSAGFICPKGAALGALHHDPDRLHRPRIRTGDAWREVEWDEAFTYIESALGPILAAGDRDALALYAGNPNVHSIAGSIYTPTLARALGTRNIFSASTVDQMPRHVSSGLTLGHPDLIPVPDIDRTDLLIIVGANPVVSNGSLATAPDWPGRLDAIRKRGRVIVLDPRRTETAARADEHIEIRPGSDAVFLLAMVNALFEADRVDIGRLEPWTDGLDALPDALGAFTPEAAESLCRVPAKTIRRLAWALADTPRAVIYGRIGTHATRFGTLASWAVTLLNLLTGHLDAPGGAMLSRSLHDRPDRGRGRGFRIGRRHSRVDGHPEVRGELPAVALVDEIATPGPGQIRALFVVGGNPVLSVPGGDRLDTALAGLDLMVSVDPYLNETSRRAHVILPPPGPLARSQYDLAFYRLAVRQIARYSPVILPTDAPPEDRILARLALIVSGAGAQADPSMVDRMIVGQLLGTAVRTAGSPVQGADPDALAEQVRPGADGVVDMLIRTGPRGDGFGADPDGWNLERLAALPTGVDFGPLESRLPEALATPDGRIHAFPAPIAADLSRLVAWMTEAPDGLVLIGRRHLRSNNSWMHNLPKLVSGRNRCALRLNPADASARGLSSGDRVRLASRSMPENGLEAVVQVTDEMMRGVVSLPHGWGHAVEGSGLKVAAKAGGVNVNRVTERALDPLSGTAALNGIPVTVARLD